MYTDIWWRNLFENVHLEHREEDFFWGGGYIKMDLGRKVVSILNGLDWIGSCPVVFFSIGCVKSSGSPNT
jgi:hypothetical protein